MPLYPDQDEPELFQYTRDDLSIIYHEFSGLPGIVEEHETWVEPLWQMAASVIQDNDRQPVPILTVEQQRQAVLYRVIEALYVVAYGTALERVVIKPKNRIAGVMMPDIDKLP